MTFGSHRVALLGVLGMRDNLAVHTGSLLRGLIFEGIAMVLAVFGI